MELILEFQDPGKGLSFVNRLNEIVGLVAEYFSRVHQDLWSPRAEATMHIGFKSVSEEDAQSTVVIILENLQKRVEVTCVSISGRPQFAAVIEDHIAGQTSSYTMDLQESKLVHIGLR